MEKGTHGNVPVHVVLDDSEGRAAEEVCSEEEGAPPHTRVVSVARSQRFSRERRASNSA